jgi:hypothetical protein
LIRSAIEHLKNGFGNKHDIDTHSLKNYLNSPYIVSYSEKGPTIIWFNGSMHWGSRVDLTKLILNGGIIRLYTNGKTTKSININGYVFS